MVSPNPLPGTAGHVLLADDDDLLRNAFRRTLARAGYVVSGAENGSEAARRLKESHADVVVSDIALPGMSGIDLLRTIREQDLDVPVILITGLPSVETAARAVE